MNSNAKKILLCALAALTMASSPLKCNKSDDSSSGDSGGSNSGSDSGSSGAGTSPTTPSGSTPPAAIICIDPSIKLGQAGAISGYLQLSDQLAQEFVPTTNLKLKSISVYFGNVNATSMKVEIRQYSATDITDGAVIVSGVYNALPPNPQLTQLTFGTVVQLEASRPYILHLTPVGGELQFALGAGDAAYPDGSLYYVIPSVMWFNWGSDLNFRVSGC